MEKDIINLDGRISKGSSRQETEYQDKIKPLNVLNAYSNKYGICLAILNRVKLFYDNISLKRI